MTSSPLSTLVTVVLEVVSDGYTLTATLVLPDINLGDRQVIRFKTAVILTTNLTSFGGPRFVIGPLQTYQVVKLSGVAQHVESLGPNAVSGDAAAVGGQALSR